MRKHNDGLYPPLALVKDDKIIAPAQFGDNLGPLIAVIDALREDLGVKRWSHLQPWCDQGDPLTCDGDALERLYERLCVGWCDG